MVAVRDNELRRHARGRSTQANDQNSTLETLMGEKKDKRQMKKKNSLLFLPKKLKQALPLSLHLLQKPILKTEIFLQQQLFEISYRTLSTSVSPYE